MIQAITADVTKGVVEVTDGKLKRMTVSSSGLGNPEQFSARELLQGALSACMTMHLRSSLAAQGVEFDAASVAVELELGTDATVIRYDMQVYGCDNAAAVEKAKQETAAGCFIKNLLSGEIRIVPGEVRPAEAEERCCGM